MKKVLLCVLAILVLTGYVYADNVTINLNQNGNVKQHNLLFRANVTGTKDEFSSPTIANGRVFIGSKSSSFVGGGAGWTNIWALNSTTGVELWNHSIGNIDGAPTVQNGKVFITTQQSDDTKLYIYNESTGVEICTYDLYDGTEVNGSAGAPAVSEGRVFVADLSRDSGASRLYAINDSDCSELWNTKICWSGSYCASNSPAVYNNKIIINTAYNGVQVLWTGNGSFIHANITSSSLYWDTSPVIINDTFALSCSSSHTICYKINLEDGSANSYIPAEEEFLGVMYATPSYYNDIFYIPTAIQANFKNYLNAYNFTSGTSVWATSISSSTTDVYASSAISSDIIATASTDDNQLFLLNITAGSYLWNYTTGGDIFSSPAIANGNLYFGADDWYLYAFDIGGGTGEWPMFMHNLNNTGYCADCLTDYQYVQSNCSTNADASTITCNITNFYSETINSITLINSYSADWYESGTKLASNAASYTYTSGVGSDSSVTLILQNVTASVVSRGGGHTPDPPELIPEIFKELSEEPPKEVIEVPRVEIEPKSISIWIYLILFLLLFI